MRRLLFLVVVLLAVSAAPAVASPTVRLAILHYVQGCHVWQIGDRVLGPSTTVTVKRGTRLEIRPNCPMSFQFAQTRGPALALGDPLTVSGSTRVLVFRKRGLYSVVARNVQTSAELGLQTLGADNTLTLNVRVK